MCKHGLIGNHAAVPGVKPSFKRDAMSEENNNPTTEAPVAIPPNPPAAADGLDPNSETAYATLVKEREARKAIERELKTLQTQLKAFEGIDPAEHRKAMEIAAKQQEFEQQQAEIRAQIEAEMQQKYEPQLRQYQTMMAEREQQLLNFQRDTELEKAFYAAGGFPGEFEPAAIALRNRVQVKDGQVIVLEPDGKTPAYVADKGQSRPKELGELIEELKGSVSWFARHFKGADRPGFGPFGTPGTVVANPDANSNDLWAAVDAQRQKQFGR